MGVSGVGKTTVAETLADVLGADFAEGDLFHPEANITKMSSGAPLTDDDRWPWLEALAAWTRERRSDGVSTVVACSALRRAYRDVLRRDVPETFFLHLTGDPELIRDRMRARRHFMPPDLLQSQFETLEPLGPDENGVVVDVAQAVRDIVDRAVAALATRTPDS
jgi:carbohydrate kinase (thermoresistant glucokinase family)